ncbi:hypothetical protein QQ045_020200 [Rhodiola kirilowii]
MDSEGSDKSDSSSSKSLFYEAPLGYCIEDVRPDGGIKKFKSAAYSNVRPNFHYHTHFVPYNTIDVLFVAPFLTQC